MKILKRKNISKLACLTVLCLVLIIVGCSGNQSDNEPVNPADSNNNELPKAGEKQCYNYFENGDTIILTIKWLDANKFTGSMVYRLKEKDGNIGTLKGQRKDSILLADYQFNSEGVTSVREVAFKQIEDYMVEGFGNVTPDSSGFKFTAPDSLQFDLNLKLQKVKCL